jgi:hypothetical protein
MTGVSGGLRDLQAKYDALPDGLIGPMANAKAQLGEALTKLDGLVSGYERAQAFLPQLLGYNGPRTYLVLPENDTELFPSGGLISSYGIATFDQGNLNDMHFEYFEALYERWQDKTHEYVEPPTPLKQYLKQGYSWGLGEAGWYPDFPTTAQLAQGFVAKGGAAQTDGTIAFDTYFIRALIGELGDVYVPSYDVTVTSENMQELTLELTRDEWDVPLAEQKAFLSDLSEALLQRIFSTPRDQWVGLLSTLDRMARERHLQLNFNDPDTQSLAAAYGLDGSIEQPEGADYLMVADTSVNSTKLNMILGTSLDLGIDLSRDGIVRKDVTYSVENPFTQWAIGRDPELVRRLMFNGVYGSYLRVYGLPQSRLLDLTFGGETVGAENIGLELGYRVFARYFPVLPGTAAHLAVSTETAGVVSASGQLRHYRLFVQKQAGTGAVPLTVALKLPDGARLESVSVGGKPVKIVDGRLTTDLSTDRVFEVEYRVR